MVRMHWIGRHSVHHYSIIFMRVYGQHCPTFKRGSVTNNRGYFWLSRLAPFRELLLLILLLLYNAKMVSNNKQIHYHSENMESQSFTQEQGSLRFPTMSNCSFFVSTFNSSIHSLLILICSTNTLIVPFSYIHPLCSFCRSGYI